MLLVPSALDPVSRRRVLVGAATLAVLGLSAAACSPPPPPPELDELLAQLDRARADSTLATDVAATTRPPLAQVLTAVAAERSAHAQALSDELTRLAGDQAPTSTPATTTAAPAKPPVVSDVVAALRRSAETAAELATHWSGYRAGLMASIAAACTAAHEVALAGTDTAP
ncbi:hypothetical protein JRC04_06390 [Mycolicibacterium sp. S2-37]|uniref:hypothetical protein n=1 Tax=Mycolicibacterium sp. S2-37 TaxID=2810297 RepID=UPI001A941431|nr:hypothetical protein [Mycolicibacterium sp. S2-37]MBO0677087.1 hypothetical protein [Mycolicibacterium sp. S2-37]